MQTSKSCCASNLEWQADSNRHQCNRCGAYISLTGLSALFLVETDHIVKGKLRAAVHYAVKWE